MDLLEWKRKQQEEATAPLAARMRPKQLDDFVGQGAIIGPGRLLRRAIQADQLSSLLFYGPPGTGKTTLAQIIANTTRAYFIALNAVLSGVKDIRASIAEAQMRRDASDQRTILFIDEVHRFNKAQQDALLPWVENGTVILIGATTENPYFEVNKALVSRSRIFQLKPLDEAALRQVVVRALADEARGYGHLNVQVEDKAVDHLVHVANGDARALLNALELAVETTPEDEAGTRLITLTVAEESIQRRAVLYDKEGDAHFDTISALIKSLRGSDPDAALYWLARMVYAGEDPRYLFRRLLILACEDVGLADPNAIAVVQACAATFDRVGMPEGQFHLAHATLYLANAPKSNSTLGFFDALGAVQKEREDEVPNHLKDPKRDKEGFGHGEGYLYPHAYREHWVAQQYLPANLQGKIFYQPSDQGWEAKIQRKVTRQREAQLAAMLEPDFTSPTELLTTSPKDRKSERWLQRTLGAAGARLAAHRDALFARCAMQRHHVVLDLSARSGLLTWEAVRQVPEGGVYACVHTKADAEAIAQQSQPLPQLQRPIILETPLVALHTLLAEAHLDLGFDWILGRHALLAQQSLAGDATKAAPDATAWTSLAESLAARLQAGGKLIMLEATPHKAQRLYALLQPGWLDDALHQRLKDAEEALHSERANDPLPAFVTALEAAGCSCHTEDLEDTTEVYLTSSLLKRWFDSRPDEPSYYDRLAAHLDDDERDLIRKRFSHHLAEKVVAWHSHNTWLIAQT